MSRSSHVYISRRLLSQLCKPTPTPPDGLINRAPTPLVSFDEYGFVDCAPTPLVSFGEYGFVNGAPTFVVFDRLASGIGIVCWNVRSSVVREFVRDRLKPDELEFNGLDPFNGLVNGAPTLGNGTPTLGNRAPTSCKCPPVPSQGG